jgi:hypothetical protein
MYKNYINLENFNHKLVIIFLEDGRMTSPIPRECQTMKFYSRSSKADGHFVMKNAFSTSPRIPQI